MYAIKKNCGQDKFCEYDINEKAINRWLIALKV